MTEQQAPPGVIPYVEHHTGERRVLTLHLTSGNSMLTAKNPPVVSIDGRQYLVYWGSVSFEVPADRAVHVSVHIEAERIGQAASALLPPGESLALTYSTDFMSGNGSLR
ncbi:hypothetical protein [Nocardioides sp. W7]|uniref:hypothetical protein n=1 Tax=Nocardioides sp. W7 TaxID=2931390 RepID=UPI001FD05CC7|nr:hypothetical protein [Nocardioides sp. W7]